MLAVFHDTDTRSILEELGYARLIVIMEGVFHVFLLFLNF